MASSIKITLRKDKVNNQGLAPIHFRITKNRKSSYISSGQYIKLSEWDSKNKRVKTSHKNSGRLNAMLSAKMTELHSQLLEAETVKKHVTGKALKHEIFGKQPIDFILYATNNNQKAYISGQIGACAD